MALFDEQVDLLDAVVPTEVPVAEFKKHWYRYLREVTDHQAQLLMTKHGRPVALLGPPPADVNAPSLRQNAPGAFAFAPHGERAATRVRPAPEPGTWGAVHGTDWMPPHERPGALEELPVPEVGPARLLLDTAVWIAAMNAQPLFLGARDRTAIDDAARLRRVYVSAVSLLEVEGLLRSGRLRTRRAPDAWLEHAVAAPGLNVVGLSPAVLSLAMRIDQQEVPDAHERIMRATAEFVGAKFLQAPERWRVRVK